MKLIITKSKVRNGLNKYHPYHMLKTSVWPVCVSISILCLLLNFINMFYEGCNSIKIGFSFIEFFNMHIFFGIFCLCIFLYFWWFDVCCESGEHTDEIVGNIKIGMCLFIVSEVMFFFSFFWSFFHFSLSPAVELGNIWPPEGVKEIVLDPSTLPLENTFLLLMSGVFVTYSHHAIIFRTELNNFLYFALGNLNIFEFLQTERKNFKYLVWSFVKVRRESSSTLGRALIGLELTCIFGLLFLTLQLQEYLEASFSISDSAYGTTFFVMTGFHGLHVLVGVTFLLISLLRHQNENLIVYNKVSTGFECAVWYWHFVDVVWLFLFLSVYLWGNL